MTKKSREERKPIVHTWMSNGTPAATILGIEGYSTMPTDQLALAVRQASKGWATVFNKALMSILNTCTHVPMTIELSKVYSVVRGWTKESIGWKLVAYLASKGITFATAPDWMKLCTMEYTIDNAGLNPVYQSIKLSYHGDWTRFLLERPRLTISLQGWLEKHLGVKPNDALLKGCLNAISDELEGIEKNFKIIQGNTTSARRDFVYAYTNYCRGDYGVSVSFSCMRSDSEDFNDEGIHPVEAYCTGDISLALVVEDSTGNTRCRCLLNEVRKTFTRIYSSGESSDKTSKLAVAFERLLTSKGYTRDFGLGLKGCTLDMHPLNSGEVIAPYIDGNYYWVDANGLVGAERTGAVAFRSTEGSVEMPSENSCADDNCDCDDGWLEVGEDE